MIKEGCHAVVQKIGGEHVRVCHLSRKQGILIEKLRFHVDSAFGQPFGLFEVTAGKLVRACAEKLVTADGIGDIELQSMESFATDTATSSAESEFACSSSPEDEFKSPAQKRQRLTQEEISQMKDNGVSAGELVAKLVDGNVSFAERSTYAQCKYIRRKTKKHSDRVLILKPTIRLIAESYFRRDAERILNFRLDLLALTLSLSGVHSGFRCLVFEQCLGLLSAAVLERLGGRGACVHIHKGQIAQAIPCVYSMDFDDDTFSSFLPLRVSSLLAGAVNEQLEEKSDETAPTEAPESEAVLLRRIERLSREKTAWDLINQKEIDSLLIAVKAVDPTEVLERVWDSLRPSANIVVYSPFAEPLFDAYHWLLDKEAVNVQLWDAFYRSYQVLPDRTHPLMQQLVAGGLVLSAIKVITS